MPANNFNTLSINAIIEMSAQGLLDSEIIDEINRTNSIYHLTAATITYLREHNVRDRVIDYMLATGE
jgi:hypothetical protein